MRTRTRRAAATVSGAVVAAVLLAGCSDTDAEADPAPSTTSEASAPTTSATADVPDVPAMPAEAEGTDDAAAVAFVEYWVELVNYAIHTGDSSPVREVTAVGCDVCTAIFDELDRTGGPDSIGTWTLTALTTREGDPGDPSIVDAIVQAAVSIDGSTPDPFGTLAAGVDHVGDGWEMTWLLNYQY